MIYRVKHITEYHYSVPVSTSHHELHVLLRG
jgi:Bacterial transglutaminase-like N-terminal region